MTSLLSRPSLCASTPSLEPCWHCRQPAASDFKADPHLCKSCESLAQEQALHEAHSVIQDLRKGSGHFAKLTAGQRMAQLAALIGGGNRADGMVCDFAHDLSNEELVSLAGAAADEIAKRMHSISPAPAKSDPAAELIYTSDGYQPSPQERDDIESRIELGPDDIHGGEPIYVPGRRSSMIRNEAVGFAPAA